MTDYSEQGAVPVEDAAVADTPNFDDVVQRQLADHPEQAQSLQTSAPVVTSPGDSDAPDVPDHDTVYPDDQGVPGDK